MSLLISENTTKCRENDKNDPKKFPSRVAKFLKF